MTIFVMTPRKTATIIFRLGLAAAATVAIALSVQPVAGAETKGEFFQRCMQETHDDMAHCCIEVGGEYGWTKDGSFESESCWLGADADKPMSSGGAHPPSPPAKVVPTVPMVSAPGRTLR